MRTILASQCHTIKTPLFYGALEKLPFATKTGLAAELNTRPVQILVFHQWQAGLRILRLIVA